MCLKVNREEANKPEGRKRFYLKFVHCEFLRSIKSATGIISAELLKINKSEAPGC